MMGDAPIWASADAGTLPWLAVAGYLAGAFLCLRQAGTVATRRERLFWIFAGLVMLALGINKQLDLQTALTAWGRQMARDGGWYADRRAFQRNFIIAAVIGMGALGGGIAWFVRGMRLPVFITLGGLAMLGVFVLVRAASFHHVDIALRTNVFGLKLHVVLELAGIAVVIFGAVRAARTAPNI
jgi:hypothetical protein